MVRLEPGTFDSPGLHLTTTGHRGRLHNVWEKSFISLLSHETSAGMIASRINRAINSEKTMLNAYSMAMNE